MIDYRNEDIESVIAQVIAENNFLKSPIEAKNFQSREFAKKMNEREKALFTISLQISADRQNLPDTSEGMLEDESLESYFDFFQEAFYKELKNNKVDTSRNIIFCADEKIYYISFEDTMNRCIFCSEYEKCEQRLC